MLRVQLVPLGLYTLCMICVALLSTIHWFVKEVMTTPYHTAVILTTFTVHHIWAVLQL